MGRSGEGDVFEEGGSVSRVDRVGLVAAGRSAPRLLLNLVAADGLGVGWTGMRFVLLHEIKNDDGIRMFFTDAWDAFVRVRTHILVSKQLD